MRYEAMRGLVLACALALGACTPLPEVLDAPPGPRIGDCEDDRPATAFERTVLVLYESTGTYGYLGAVHAQMVMNLLGHFDEVRATAKPRLDYEAGDLQAHDVTFVLGTSGDERVPDHFAGDFWAADESTVVWIGFDLWQLVDPEVPAQDAGAFRARFGFTIEDHVDEGSGTNGCGDFYANVWFRGEAEEDQHFFKKVWSNPLTGRDECDPYVTVVDDVGAAEVIASLWTETEPRRSTPWILHHGVDQRHLWFVTDIPFTYLHREDRYIVFADQMHEFLGISHPPSRQAFVRLEDVHALTQPDSVRRFGELMDDRPWTVALIPEFRDPLGVTRESGRPYYRDLSDRRARLLVERLTELVEDEDKDVGIVLHGYTHQFGFEANDFNGMTGNDYEFWDAAHDAPLPGDSVELTTMRIGAAQYRADEVGLLDDVWGFEFPHYKASLAARLSASEHFCSTYHQGEYWDWSGSDGSARVDFGDGFSTSFAEVDLTALELDNPAPWGESQYFPYVIGRDVYGQRVVPENLGPLSPLVYSYDWEQVNEIDDLIRTARKNLVANCATASFFFHPFLVPLEESVSGTSGEDALLTIVDQLEAWDYVFTDARTVGPPAGTDEL